MPRIIEAGPEDLETVQELSVRLSEKEAEEFDPTIDPEWNTSEEADQYFQERITGEGFAVVAEHEGTVVGYALGGTRPAEDYRDDLKLAEMETMYLEPEYRGQGIGTQFMEEFGDWARQKDADRMRVEVTAQNEKGHSFYQGQGLEDYAVTLEKEL